MINNKDNKDIVPSVQPNPTNGFTDLVPVDVQAHILIIDKDTGEILVKQRG